MSMTNVAQPTPDATNAPAVADEPHPSLSLCLAPRGMQVADSRGYLIYVVVEAVPNAMYRAWAEIIRDGKRVERSGLVGPRFADARHAQQFALDWARQWIDRECATDAAAATMADASTETASAPASANPVQRSASRPLPGLRHVSEPMSINSIANHAVDHSAPLHGPLKPPLNALRGPLRRYPSESATAGVASTPTLTSDGSAAERFSPICHELISHVR
jgi:hypothetical protein